MTWFDQCRDVRLHDLPRVMQCVRFANIDSYYFSDAVDSNPTLCASAELSRLFDKVRSYHLLPNRRHEVLHFIS